MLFKDITGWREELEQLQKGAAYKAMYPVAIRNPEHDPKIPRSVILDFAETLLLDVETRDALLAVQRWRQGFAPGAIRDFENDPNYPWEATKLLTDFRHWYELRTGFGPTTGAYLDGEQVADLVLAGTYPGVRCAESEEFLASKYYIDATR